jgi:hypothetical protein
MLCPNGTNGCGYRGVTDASAVAVPTAKADVDGDVAIDVDNVTSKSFCR